MQIKGSNGFALGVKSKSNMAEFSSNPDDRKKSEVSIEEHNKRKLANEDRKRSYRVFINKQRVEKALYTFKDSERFEEICEDSELNGEELTKYLLQYNKNDESTTIPSIDSDMDISRTTIIQGEPYIETLFLSNLLSIDNDELLSYLNKQCQLFNVRYNSRWWNDILHYELIPSKNSNRYYVSLSIIIDMAINYELSISNLNKLISEISNLIESYNKLTESNKSRSQIKSHKNHILVNLDSALRKKISKLNEKS